MAENIRPGRAHFPRRHINNCELFVIGYIVCFVKLSCDILCCAVYYVVCQASGRHCASKFKLDSEFSNQLAGRNGQSFSLFFIFADKKEHKFYAFPFPLLMLINGFSINFLCYTGSKSFYHFFSGGKQFFCL
jgi:hypothetical protein